MPIRVFIGRSRDDLEVFAYYPDKKEFGSTEEYNQYEGEHVKAFEMLVVEGEAADALHGMRQLLSNYGPDQSIADVIQDLVKKAFELGLSYGREAKPLPYDELEEVECGYFEETPEEVVEQTSPSSQEMLDDSIQTFREELARRVTDGQIVLPSDPRLPEEERCRVVLIEERTNVHVCGRHTPVHSKDLGNGGYLKIPHDPHREISKRT